MNKRFLNLLPFPRSLRWQFRLALTALTLLIVAGSLIAVYALRVSTGATQELAERRLLHMQEAEDLVQRTLVIEGRTRQMLEAKTTEEMRGYYDDTIQQMDALDGLVEKLSTATADVSVLTLQQSEQLFRTSVVIMADLRGKQLRAEATNNPAALLHYHEQLEQQGLAMAASAQALSARFTKDYRAAVQRVAHTSMRNERWVIALFIASLLIAWEVSRRFNQHVLARLQVVSNSLRQDHPEGEPDALPVQGADEVSEMARAVQQFLNDRRQLAEAHQELEAFSYSVSHDLRAPLRAIAGFCSILTSSHSKGLDATGKGLLQRIEQSANRMEQLIKDILALSRMSRSEMALEPVNMEALAREVFEEVRRPVPNRNIVLRVGQLPPARADRVLTRQVLMNLLSNAVKFTAPRTEAVIEVDCTERGEMNTYCVKDNGVGFDMANAPRLFAVFQRLHTAQEFEGTGIGLAIVKRIIVRHGGGVWAQSKKDEGTGIYFTLPAG